jgi:hypothetical protein
MEFMTTFGTAPAELGENFMSILRESSGMSRGTSFRALNTEHMSSISLSPDYKIQEETICKCVTYVCSEVLLNPLNAELNPICHLLILLGDLTFMGTCIVSSFKLYPTRCNVTQFIYVWKLLYMFRVILPPTIRSAYNCIHSIWYLSHRYCYLPLSWKSWNWFECAVGGFHSPSGAHTTVSTAYGICHTVTAICRYRGNVGTGLSVLWLASTHHQERIQL